MQSMFFAVLMGLFMIIFSGTFKEAMAAEPNFKDGQAQYFNKLEYKTLDWEFDREHSDESKFTWLDNNSPAVITFNYFGIEPDIPTIKDVNRLRELYRSLANQNNGAIIKVEIGRIQNVETVGTIFKFPMKPRGMRYIGSITIPYKDRSYVLKVECPEVGTTGMRDSVIMNKMLGDGVVTVDFEKRRMKGWFKDPYDDSLTEGFHMNLSEAEEFDEMFPKHPLTIVRRTMAQFPKIIKLDDGLEKFDK